MAFVQYIPRPASTQYNSLDFSGLNTLRRGVQAGANADLADQKKVAQQFEALFIQQMLKQAHQSSKGGPFDSQQTKLAESLRDEQLAGQLANPGLGLAQAILNQIRAVQGAGQVTLDASQAMPPEAAPSRLPELRSSIGDNRPVHASSISSLIDLISKQNVSRLAEQVKTAVSGAPAHIHNFVNRMRDAARLASQESGVPEKLMLSQAALESGWGKREIRGEDGTNSYNLFGIKATSGWTGKVVNVMTTEYVDGEPRKMLQPFRAYNSYAESFADYARLISQADRYSDVLAAPTAEEAARKVQEAGYATDPNYADKLISIMGYFDTGNASMMQMASVR
jgi:flagellar protein FlgJ